jgi:DNA invertase Pin-like site-specific DNA recombinase
LDLNDSDGDLVGYARVSTQDQDPQLQINALIETGVNKKLIFQEKESGAREDRPELLRCLGLMEEGDTLVVWKLDRLGRNTKHLIEIIQQLEARKINFRSLTESIDTGSAIGRLFFNVIAALAEFERDCTLERTSAGLKAARAKGHLGGRKRLTADNPKVKMAKKLFEDPEMTPAQICDIMNIARPTLYKYLKVSNEERT